MNSLGMEIDNQHAQTGNKMEGCCKDFREKILKSGENYAYIIKTVLKSCYVTDEHVLKCRKN